MSVRSRQDTLTQAWHGTQPGLRDGTLAWFLAARSAFGRPLIFVFDTSEALRANCRA